MSDSGDNDHFEGIEEVLELFTPVARARRLVLPSPRQAVVIRMAYAVPVWSSRVTWHKSALTDFRLTTSFEIAVCRDGSFSREAA